MTPITAISAERTEVVHSDVLTVQLGLPNTTLEYSTDQGRGKLG